MEKRGIILGYSIVLIIFSIISIIHDISLLLQTTIPKLTTTILIGGIIIFLYSLITLALLRHYNYKRQYYYLPIFFLMSYLLFFGLGIALRNIIPNNITIFLFVSAFIGTLQLLLGIYSVTLNRD